MLPNYFKIIISLCLLLLLNACGIGRYHNLKLVRPDKNTTTVLVKPKHKIKKVTETVKVDTAILETTEETVLTKTVNTFSEKTENLAIALLKKPSQHAKKIKIGLKEKVLIKVLKHKTEHKRNGVPFFLFLVPILAVSLLTLGIIFLFINTLPAILLIIASLFFWLISLTTAEIRFMLAYAAPFLSIIPLIIGIVFLFIDLPIALWVIAISLVLLLISKLSYPKKWPFG